jgi:hypothetical protein
MSLEDRADQRSHGRPAIVGALRQTSAQGMMNAGVRTPPRPLEPALGVRERLAQRKTEAELIGLGPRRPALALLGRHVCGRPHHGTRLGERRVLGRSVQPSRDRASQGAPHARQAEVHHAHTAVVTDEHVGRFEVAMDHAGLVCSGQALRRREEDLHDFGPRSRSGVEPPPQVRSVHVLHTHVGSLFARTHVVHRQDVGMAQACQRLSFAADSGDGRRAPGFGAIPRTRRRSASSGTGPRSPHRSPPRSRGRVRDTRDRRSRLRTSPARRRSRRPHRSSRREPSPLL